MADNVYSGNYVRMNYGELPLTKELKTALALLDKSCQYGSGGRYDIVKSNKANVLWKAVPADGPFDSLYFDGREWREG